MCDLILTAFSDRLTDWRRCRRQLYAGAVPYGLSSEIHSLPRRASCMITGQSSNCVSALMLPIDDVIGYDLTSMTVSRFERVRLMTHATPYICIGATDVFQVERRLLQMTQSYIHDGISHLWRWKTNFSVQVIKKTNEVSDGCTGVTVRRIRLHQALLTSFSLLQRHIVLPWQTSGSAIFSSKRLYFSY